MIQDNLSKVVYVADGIQKQWDIPFEFYKIEDVHIYITSDGEHVEEIDQNYYYDKDGKFFIYPTEESKLDPIPAGTQVLILRETENTQLEDSSEIYFKSKDIERGLDNLTMQVQDLKRDSLRAVKLSHFATQTPEDFAKGIFEAERLATEAAARAAASESNASLSEQNAASSKLSAEQASATAVIASQLATSKAEESLRNAERAEQASADSCMHASDAAESASTAATLLQEVSNSIYDKAQVDEKISGLQAEIDTVEASIPAVKEEINKDLSELQAQITSQSSAIAGKQDKGDYATVSQVNAKQDKLIAGSNITINGNVISATGGGGGGGNAGSADVAKAVENQNKTISATEPIYNWLGTQKEYEEQNVAQEHPDWVCFITDDAEAGEEDKKDCYTKEEVDGKISEVESAINEQGLEIENTKGDVSDLSDRVQILEDNTSGGGESESAKVAEGVENKNDKDGAIEPIYHWIGTKVEYEEQKIATEHPDWVSFIIDDTDWDNGGGSDVVLPDNVYTQENLLGGKNIEIVPEPVEGGIDEHTLACWHFDGDKTDVIAGQTISGDNSSNNCKFGTAGLYRNYNSQVMSFSGNTGTIDFWYLKNGTDNLDISFNGAVSSSTPLGWLFRLDPASNVIQFGFRSSSGFSWNPIVEKPYNFSSTDFIHIAAQRLNSNNYNLFINGSLFIEGTATDNTGWGKLLVSSSGCFIDELRVSDVVRYNSDFTPPTQAYRVAVPTGNYVINFTGEASSSSVTSKNIGEVYYSQSSLASDNAGALPLFTGETIASANTIYPDFYTWVEKHPELTTNPTEYQNLLDKYGECPLYCLEQVASEESRIVYSYNFTDLKQNCLDTLDYVYGYFDGNSFVKIDKNSEYGLFYTSEPMSNTGTINQYPVYLDAGLTKRLYGYAKTNLDDDYKYRPLFLGLNIEYSYITFYIFVGEDEQTQRAFGDAWVVAPSTVTSTQGSTIAKFYSYTKDGSLRLPKLSNYIKMANAFDGITQKEAGLPNITGQSGTLGYTIYNDLGTAAESEGALKQISGSSTRDGGSSNIIGTNITLDASLSSDVYGNSNTVTPAHTTLYPWVYAFSASIPASTAQAAEFQNALSGKADSTLGNIPSNYDYVIERYDDGDGNWCEVWKSGKLRQGGFFGSNVSSWTNATINYLKPFSDLNYSLICMGNWGDAQNSSCKIIERTVTNATVTYANNLYSAQPSVWVAEGQGAEL